MPAMAARQWHIARFSRPIRNAPIRLLLLLLSTCLRAVCILFWEPLSRCLYRLNHHALERSQSRTYDLVCCWRRSMAASKPDMGITVRWLTGSSPCHRLMDWQLLPCTVMVTCKLANGGRIFKILLIWWRGVKMEKYWFIMVKSIRQLLKQQFPGAGRSKAGRLPGVQHWV